MRKMNVLLVDDEPVILKGLQQIINWEEEGCNIIGTCNSGNQAYDFLRDNDVDLAIVDVRMPEMTGLELIDKVRKNKVSDAEFIILSGYRDFEYAREALSLGVVEYLTKPVKAKQLENAIRKNILKVETSSVESETREELKRAKLVQDLHLVIGGKASPEQIAYVKENIETNGSLNYIYITLNNIASLDEMADDEVDNIKRNVVENCRRYLGKNRNNLITEDLSDSGEYELGFVFCSSMASEAGVSDKVFLENLRKSAMPDIPSDIALLVGKTVPDISKLSRSYSSASLMRPLRGIHKEKSIFYYDDDVHVSQGLVKSMIPKECLDELIEAIDKHDPEQIDRCVDRVMESMGNIDHTMMNMNLNYLLFRLIHQAVEIDEMVEQDTILLYISDYVFGTGSNFKDDLKKFSHEYSDYLDQLRQNSASGGLIKEIEREIKEHYSENLTLRDLGKKYYINSSYLGQMFRKVYGTSFRDYLNNYRVGMAAEMLVRSDRKVSDIASEVGYRDIDYFVNKFYEVYGCTPTKYRRKI
ncbi:MAG: response regulator [Clostridiales bacterium]|nr:response regulator [Clostridiales bacterium]